MNSYFPDM